MTWVIVNLFQGIIFDVIEAIGDKDAIETALNSIVSNNVFLQGYPMALLSAA
jgi:hypothetical protein